jgi:hypothetical protein
MPSVKEVFKWAFGATRSLRHQWSQFGFLAVGRQPRKWIGEELCPSMEFRNGLDTARSSDPDESNLLIRALTLRCASSTAVGELFKSNAHSYREYSS